MALLAGDRCWRKSTLAIIIVVMECKTKKDGEGVLGCEVCRRVTCLCHLRCMFEHFFEYIPGKNKEFFGFNFGVFTVAKT